MEQYTIYCTEEQTRRAHELGAPIKTISYDPPVPPPTGWVIYKGNCCKPPTTEQMIGWLEENGFWYINITYYVVRDYWCYYGVTNGGHDSISYNIHHYNSRKEATLAAIDAALDYLSKKE